MTEQDKRELDRHFAWFEGKLPPKPARFVTWLRKPSSRLARIPLAILLIVGGFFSFLPVLRSGSRVVQASCEQAINDSPSWQPALCSNESPA